MIEVLVWLAWISFGISMLILIIAVAHWLGIVQMWNNDNGGL